MAFHSKDGWYFQRENDGSVTITTTDTKSVHLDAGTWASAVASVSARGETAETFREVERLHSSASSDCP